MEVLIAIALLVLLGGAMFGFLGNLAERRAELADLGRQAQATEALISGLEHDLLTAIAGDAGAGAGIIGRRNQLRVLSRSVVLDLSNPSLGDLQQTTYRFRPQDGAVECTRRDVYAQAAPRGDSEDAAPDNSAATETTRPTEESRASRRSDAQAEQILTGVAKVEFRYYDRGQWKRSFNSQRTRRLPAAVEIAIWYERPEREEENLAAPLEEQPLDEAELARQRQLFGEEYEQSRLGFDLADVMEEEEPADRRRVIVIPQVGLVETAADEGDEPTSEEGSGDFYAPPVEGATEGGF
jgi:hypothetical protein